MLKTIVGQKAKMDHTYIQGARVPVTKVVAGPCVVTHIKNEQKDGYWAVQLGFGAKPTRNVSKPLQGHLRGVIKANFAPRFLREVRVKDDPEMKVGDVISASDILKRGDIVQVTGISKGKGFAGVVKRWGFAGGPKTHGQSDRLRAPGSIGQGTTPGRVLKGKKMGGRMGGEQVTVKNLIITAVDDAGEVAISGAIPGHPGSVLMIKKIGAGKLSDLVHETVVAQVSEEDQEAQEATTETGENKPEESNQPEQTAENKAGGQNE
jgi:large subunit ribosomal protein L3